MLSILAMHQSLYLSNTQTTKASTRIKHCSSRIWLPVLPNNYWFLFRCIREHWQPLLCLSFNSLYLYVVNIGHTSQSLCLSNTQTTKASIRIEHCSSRILLSVLSYNNWFLFRCIREYWQPVLVCHSILYTYMLPILAIHHSLFVWAIHRPPKLALESNIALPGYYYLFYQIIIGFCTDVYVSTGNKCLFAIDQFFILMLSILARHHSLFVAAIHRPPKLALESNIALLGYYYLLKLSQSLCLSNTQTTKASIRIEHCSSRILLSVLSYNNWFLFRCIHEYWQPVLVCHSILSTYVVNIGHTSQSLCLSNTQTTKASIRIKHCSSRIL